jgi:hypothetical protein
MCPQQKTVIGRFVKDFAQGSADGLHYPSKTAAAKARMLLPFTARLNPVP